MFGLYTFQCGFPHMTRMVRNLLLRTVDAASKGGTPAAWWRLYPHERGSDNRNLFSQNLFSGNFLFLEFNYLSPISEKFDNVEIVSHIQYCRRSGLPTVYPIAGRKFLRETLRGRPCFLFHARNVAMMDSNRRHNSKCVHKLRNT